MFLGAVLLASIAGLIGFVVSLVCGGSVVTSIVIYTTVGIAMTGLVVLWNFMVPLLDQKHQVRDADWSISPQEKV